MLSYDCSCQSWHINIRKIVLNKTTFMGNFLKGVYAHNFDSVKNSSSLTNMHKFFLKENYVIQ